MLYAIVCKDPFIYLYNEKADILQSDYEFVVESPEECGVPVPFVREEFKSLVPSEFSKILDTELTGQFVYTFEEGSLVKRLYRKAPYFYLTTKNGIEYPTYCLSDNSIKAGLLTNKELLPVVSALVGEYYSGEMPEVSLDIPHNIPDDCGSVLAYVCVPVVMKSIPIGVESDEEKQEVLDDLEDDNEEEEYLDDF